MTEYIVRTDKPIRLDEVLHLHGVHNFEVKRMDKHGRLIDAVALKGSIEGKILAGQDVNVFSEIDNAPTVLEAST